MSIYQKQLIEFLGNTDSYQDKPKHVKIIQTHISIVAVTDVFVYKIKKHVDFGFVDYSTLQKRFLNCEREIKLNSRLCPDLYIGIESISRSQNGLVFGNNDGTIIEYAVAMHRLSDAEFLHVLLHENKADQRTIINIGNKLADFYQMAATSKEIASYGSIDKVLKPALDNFKQIEPYIQDTITTPVLKTLRSYTQSFIKNHASVFEQRIKDHRIRDCHGDLRLDHIHIKNNKICIYDCIEFNQEFRYIDIASDLAFFCVSLEADGFFAYSRIFARHMADLLQDKSFFKVFNFYKVYRAFVRGKVNSMISSDEEIQSDVRALSHTKATHYFQLALDYVLGLDQPVLILVGGMVGTGKSNLAAKLADSTGLTLLVSDRIRKTNAGLPLAIRPADTIRKDLYSPEMSQLTYDTLFNKAGIELANARSVILDATFSKKRLREQARNLALKHNARCITIEAYSPASIIKERLLARETKKKVVSDARLSDYDSIVKSYECPKGEKNVLQINTALGSKENSLSSLLQAMNSLVNQA